MADNTVILSTVEVAELLDMSTQEVTRGAREGWLPAFRDGHAWQFDRDQVVAWLKAHPAVPGSRTVPT